MKKISFTQKDIEKLGFEASFKENYFTKKDTHFENADWQIHPCFESGEVIIYDCYGERCFKGVIKNKLELIKVIQQVTELHNEDYRDI